MNIQKFSKLACVSTHTIRYYEKIGLLKQITRNSSGHRFFTEKDLAWVEFIKRLKDTGMSLKNIYRYSQLRDKGASTSQLRMDILYEHVATLEEKIADEQFHLQMLKQKIEYYKKNLS